MNKTVEEIIASGDVMQIEQAIRQYESEQLYDFDLFSYKVSLCMLKGENEKAYEYAKEAVQHNPFSIEANYNLGVTALELRKSAEAYWYLLCVQHFQKRSSLYLIDEDLIESKLQYIREMSKQDEMLEQQLYLLDNKFQFACHEPFKTMAELGGKIITSHDHKNYYIGCAESLLDSYFEHLHGQMDSYHAVCEAFEIDAVTNYYEIDARQKMLLPICMNYQFSAERGNMIWDTENSEQTLYYDSAKCKYVYLPVEGRHTFCLQKEAVFGKALPLVSEKKKKRLVMGIFIDSVNELVFKKHGLKNVMPNTERFFSKGIICSECYSGSEWTLSSMASYWTGQYSNHHMNLDEDFRFDFMEKNQKVLAEYFKENGYVTAQIGGNDAVTMAQGYNRGIDRTLYKNDYRTKHILEDVLQHLETFSETNQFVLVNMVDLHDVAGGFMRSLKVQSETPLQDRKIDNQIKTTVKQTHSKNREKIYVRELQEIDFWLGQLYDYIEKKYCDEEITISLFSDHGTAFMVDDTKAFISEERVNIPFMIRDGSLKAMECNEIIQNVDYAAILCKLAGIEYQYENTDANLPVIFGGKTERTFAFSQTIFAGDPYQGALHGKNFHYYFETKMPVTSEYQIDISGAKSYILDNKGKVIEDAEKEKEYKQYILQQIGYLIRR